MRQPYGPRGEAIRTHAEVAEILKTKGIDMTDKAVRNCEERALKKLRKALVGMER